MEWSIKEIWLLLWLGIWTWWDAKYRVIRLRQGILVIATGVMWRLAEGSLWTADFCGGALLGAAAWGFSIVTEDRFGRGDALVILCLGVYLGFAQSLSALLWGLMAASVVSLYLMLVKHRSAKTSIPFVPCLAAGCGVMLGIRLLSG